MSEVAPNYERALDALADRVAVLDTSGKVLHTNRAWDEFEAERDVESTACEGANYLGVAGAGDAEFAAAAKTGIEAVLDGERETFTVEYPYRDSEREQWFRLRATRFEDEGETRAVASHTDVTESRLAGEELRKSERALRALYEVTTERDADFETKLERVLELGCERVGLPLGFLTYIDVADERQDVVSARGDHALLQEGASEDLARAYCRKTIESDGLLGVRDAPAEGWTDDPAYERFELACYLGGKVTVDGDLYGTLCFADTDPRGRTFTPSERAFVEVLTQWVSYELERRERERALAESEQRFRSVFEEAFDAMLVADDDGEYVEVNAAACDLFGLEREELLGRTIEEFAADGYDFEAAWEDFEHEGGLKGTFPLVRSDGTERIVEYVATFDFLPGRHLSVVRDVTERKRAEREAERNAAQTRRERERLEHVLDRIGGLFRDVVEVLVQGRTREEVERGVCERLADADPYRFAWVGATDLRRETVAARRWAGEGPDVEGLELRLDGDATDPCVAAIATGEVQIAVDPRDDADLAPAHAAALADADDVSAMVAIPLAYKDAVYGVLAVYADRADAFDSRERVVLETLGVEIANAINAMESGRILTANRVVELEFDVYDDLSAGEIAAAGDCRLSYVGSTSRTDGTLRQLWTAETSNPEAVVATAEEQDRIRTATRVTERDGDHLFEVVVEDSFIAEMADYGAVTRAIDAEDGRTRVALDLPNETAARSVYETMGERFETIELVGFRESERPTRTRQEFASTVAERLTERQSAALKTAYFGGYFEWPRPMSGDDLAASLGVTRSTVHQHLRAAERKVFQELFEDAEPN